MKTIIRSLLVLFLSAAVSSASWITLHGLQCPGTGHLQDKPAIPGYWAVEDGPDYVPVPSTNLYWWTGTMVLHTNYDCNYGGGLLVEYPDACRQHDGTGEGWNVAEIKAYPDGSSTPCATVIAKMPYGSCTAEWTYSVCYGGCNGDGKINMVGWAGPLHPEMVPHRVYVGLPYKIYHGDPLPFPDWEWAHDVSVDTDASMNFGLSYASGAVESPTWTDATNLITDEFGYGSVTALAKTNWWPFTNISMFFRARYTNAP